MINPKVIDLYRLNEVTSFAQAHAAGLRGVIHKASEGLAQPPREAARYAERRHMAADEGLLWGAYHFLRPGRIIDQAHRFVDLAAPGASTLLALDHEDANVPLADAVAFMREVLADTRRGIIDLYSGFLVKEQLANASGELVAFLKSSTRLWLSQYGPRPIWPAAVWEKPFLWQFTGDGEGPGPHEIPGIAGNADINSFNGSDEELAAQWSGA